MQGVPLPGRVFGRRWRLALHEVDARPGDPAVCVVPVIGHPLREASQTVEVKGRPRPGGEVVVRELAGRRWWPTGRVMVGARSTFDAEASPSPMRTDRGPIPAGAIAMAGIAFGLLVLGVVGYGAMAATEARAEVHEAEVVAGEGPGAVTVELAWAGVRRTAQVDAPGPVEVGGTVDVRVDPDDPGRIWADGDDTPDDRVPNWAVAALTAAMALGGVAVAACRSPRAGIGDRLRSAVDDAPAAGRFRLVDGTLWYVPDGPSATVDPSLGFEPSGLVVVRPDTLALWSWDRHVGRDPSPHRWYAACDGRRLSLVAPHALVVLDAPDGAAVVDLVEAVVRTPGVQERLADRSWLEDLLAAIADAGARTGRAGPTITGDGGAAPDG